MQPLPEIAVRSHGDLELVRRREQLLEQSGIEPEPRGARARLKLRLLRGAGDHTRDCRVRQREGKIKHIGVSNFGVQQLKEALATGVTIACNQLCYNLIFRAAEFEIYSRSSRSASHTASGCSPTRP